MEKVKYWIATHNADLTETGMPQNRTYIKTTWVGFQSQQSAEREIVEQFCFERFGPKVGYVQGVAPCPGWQLLSIKQGDYDLARPIIWGGCSTKTSRVELEIGRESDFRIVSDLVV